MKSIISKMMWMSLVGLLTLSLSSTVMAAKYTVDQSHTTIGFVVSHLVISKVRGNFQEFEGSVEINDKTKEVSNVQATIQTASINTNNTKRDNHLRSSDFFKADEFPTITFNSTQVKKTGDKTYEVTGDLSIRGVTKQVTLTGELLGMIDSPNMGKRAGFVAEGTINRNDFGVSWSRMLDTGGPVVGNEVTLTIEAEVIAQN